MFVAKISGIVIAAVTLMSGFAHAEPILFGQLRTDYDFVDDGDSDKHCCFSERGSRLGLKGASLINQHYEFTYIVEAESDIAGADEIFNEVRQAWAGVRVDDAEIRIGRHLSPTRVSVVPVDMFVNQGADQRKILESDKVFDKSVVYLSRIDKLAYAVALSADSANNHVATDFLINYRDDNAYIAAAYLKGDDQQRVSRLAATYLLPADHQLGLAFEYLDDKGIGDDHKAYVVSAGYRLDEQKLMKFQYGANKSSAGGRAETLLGVGLDVRVSDNTTWQFQYSTNRHMDHAGEHDVAVTAGIAFDF